MCLIIYRQGYQHTHNHYMGVLKVYIYTLCVWILRVVGGPTRVPSLTHTVAEKGETA